jgi:hypothetical protein
MLSFSQIALKMCKLRMQILLRPYIKYDFDQTDFHETPSCLTTFGNKKNSYSECHGNATKGLFAGSRLQKDRETDGRGFGISPIVFNL